MYEGTLTGGEHGFSTLRHCRRGQGFRMLEITLPDFSLLYSGL